MGEASFCPLSLRVISSLSALSLLIDDVLPAKLLAKAIHRRLMQNMPRARESVRRASNVLSCDGVSRITVPIKKGRYFTITARAYITETCQV